MKKFTSLIVLLVYICSSFSVFASESFYYDDFSGYNEGDTPEGITCSASYNSELYITKADVDGVSKNVIRLEHDNAIISLIKSVESSSVVTAKMRFRRVGEGKTEFPSIVLVARRNEKEVFRIYLSSNNNRIVINSSLGTTSLLLPSNLGEIYIKDDAWSIFSIYVNTVTHKAGFQLESDELKDLTLIDNVNVRYDTKSGIAVGDNIDIDESIDCIDDIRVYTGGGYTGIFEIDYIDIDNKDNPFTLVKEKPEPLPLPIAKAQEERLVPDTYNVVVNDSVTYYPMYPIIRNGITYAEYKKTFETLGYTAFLDGDIITAINDNSEITLDYKTGELNIDGDIVNITKGRVKNDLIMIPSSEIAAVLGYNVREGDNNTLYISKDELFGLNISPYTFKGTTGEEGDDNIYIFQFGQRDNKFEDVGIEINGKKYQAKNFDESTGRKFGIGISDPSGLLGDKYIIKPYYGNRYNDVIEVDKNAVSN